MNNLNKSDDHQSEASRSVEDPPDIEANLKNRSTWRRLVFMIVVGALYAVSRPVIGGVIVLQFFWVLFTAESNKKLTDLGHSLALYSAELIDYLCYVTDDRPFPFDGDWPSSD